MEMRAHQIERGEVADPLIERGASPSDRLNRKVAKVIFRPLVDDR